jgi:Rrf2 family protein
MVALAELTNRQRPVPLSFIAEKEGIPEPFLNQIIAQLRKAGFVDSVRGVHGGYLLNRSAEKISIGELVRVLEGSLAPMDCIEPFREGHRIVCNQVQTCHLRHVWLRLMEAITQSLNSFTLADIIRDE